MKKKRIKAPRSGTLLRHRLGKDMGREQPEPDKVEPPKIDEEALERETETRRKRTARSERLCRRGGKAVQILLAAGCVYLVFIFYGLMVTEYDYNKQGEVVPRIVTAEQIKAKVQFDEIFNYYLQARTLYEDALRLDYRLSTDTEAPKLLATEYEGMLDDVSKLSLALEAVSTDTKYNPVKSLLEAWVKSDIAVYLQNMGAALSQNNEEKANNALQDRDRMYQDFAIITENVAALGGVVPGMDLTTLYEWSPERFVTETLEGVPYEQD